MDNPTNSLAVRSIVQELQWIIPGIRVAVVSDPNDSLAIDATSGAFGVVRFQGSKERDESSHVLEWFCGADAWLLVDTTPLAEAFRIIAADLRTPYFLVSPRIRRAGWDELASQIARSFEFTLNHQTVVAFRNPIAPHGRHRDLTVDAALQLLRSALVPERFPEKVPMRHAA